MMRLEWFEPNNMKLTQDKRHFLSAGYKYEMFFANVGKVKIWENTQHKFLGALIDRGLKFDEYVLPHF